MRILITNIEMAAYSGTVIVVRDFALILRRRGHSVAVYTTLLGHPASDLVAQGIEVVDDIERLSSPPDVIHGHHNIPAVIAMARFRRCPAIWFCHSSRDFDEPLRLGQIHRYVAVDRTRREFLIAAGIPPERVEIFHNAVDLARIPPRPVPLREAPASALCFSKHSGHIPTLASVCAELGIAFTVLGMGVGKLSRDPEQQMVGNDIVFATGRCAIEAACAGCAVVVVDGRGILGMVTTRNYQAMRTNNFGSGAKVLWKEATDPAVRAELARYDPADASKVAERIRADADLEKAADRVEQLYREAMATPPDGWSAADAQAVQDLLANWPRNPAWPGLGEKEHAKLAALAGAPAA